MPKAAIFWDRDGTLIEDPGYLRDPDQVRLVPGAASALKRLASAGFENIITTNQSGVARGMMDEAAVQKIHQRLRELLDKDGARLDAIYYCPYLDGPEAMVEQYRQDSDLRKPKPGMLVKASLERNLDLPASWSIGDSLRDAEAGRAAGCRTILISQGGEVEANTARRSVVDFVAASVEEATDIVLRCTPGLPTASAGGLVAGTVPSTPASPSQATASTERVLQEILAILQRMDRRARTEDFSLARLGGAILQMVAIAALIWAFFGLSEPPDRRVGVQVLRLSYAMVFQLLALTLFVVGGKKS